MTSKDQPDWVCNNCNEQFGKWWVDDQYIGPSSYYATYHSGPCEVCNQVKYVTEARDFGYLRSDWKN